VASGKKAYSKGWECRYIKMVDNSKEYGKMESGKNGYDLLILNYIQKFVFII
jgi:6-phosphogluconate dehydrogenase (decarboxylating)